MHTSFKSLAVLAAVASASATSFKLKVHVTDFDLTPSIEGQEVSVESDTGYAFLTQAGSGAVFTDPPNSIDTDATGSTTHIHITPGGTATVPSLNVVTFSDEPGTLGVAFDENTALTYEGGVFTVCPASRLDKDGDNNLVSFKSAGQRTIYGCANVELQEATA
ncbi:hypothetical protein PENSPDRAFT_333051 [Peniophora sp. CONT]|nr:hypothetical protein PENSPDRAFT_333051 [Peniophora sp. CONT]